MNKSTPLGLVGLLSIGFAFLGCASGTNVVSMGNDTYSITSTASTGFMRSPGKLEERAREEAARYCESQGKVMKLISIS